MKVYDLQRGEFILYNLIFAELTVNEIDKESLSLKKWVNKQCVKTNNIYSDYNEITSGVPHSGFFLFS